jgi:DNA-binding transcriptional LysR family regulator
VELRQLEYFIAVAREMNFSRAAQRVHVVQSALSTSVSKLEKELGVELFDRSRQQIKITPAGELFREHARRVIQTARLARDSVSDYRGALSGTIDIGSLISFGGFDFPKILGEFHLAYPFVRIRLRHSAFSGSMNYLSAIAYGSLDLAFVSSPDRFPTGIVMRPVSREPMLFVCRPDHHLAQRDHIGIADLANDDLISLPSEFGLQRIINDSFAAAGVVPHMPYEAIVDYSFAAALVRNSLGSVFMPESDANRFPDLRAVPVRPAIDWRIFLATAERTQLAPASAKLAELVIASAGETATA